MKLVKLQSQQVPTFLWFRGQRRVAQQCCIRLHSTSNNVAPAHAHYMPRIHTNTCEQEIDMAPRRIWKTSQSPLYSHPKTQHVMTCCERLHTSANIAQQETTLLGPTMLRVAASVCTGLKIQVGLSQENEVLSISCLLALILSFPSY